MKRSQRAPVVMPSELISVDHPFYNSPTVHKEMLCDKKRTLSFKSALKKIIKKGSKVYDLGTGTGILAMFAAKSGASKVYASDAEFGMFEAARQNIKDNGLENKIQVFSFSGRPIKLPEKIDILVSECLGHFAFDEGMVRAVSESKYLLKKDGKFVPNRIRLFVAPTSDSYIYKEYIERWKKSFYGFNFSSMAKKALEQIYIGTFFPADLLSKSTKIVDYEVGKSTESIFGTGTINITKTGTIYGVVGWFEADLAEGVVLSTSPFTKSTHWEQSFLPLPQPLKVQKGDEINFSLKIKPEMKNSSRVVFIWELESKKLKHHFSKAVV